MISYALLVRPAGEDVFRVAGANIGLRPEGGVTLEQVLNTYENIATDARKDGSECILVGPLQYEPEMHRFSFSGEALRWVPQ